MWVSMQRISSVSRWQQSTSAVLPCGRGGSAHSLVIKALVMSHEEGVGGGWDREIKRKKREGEGEEVRVGEGCLHYLQVSSHVARRLTDFYCLAMNLPALCSSARVPVHLSTAHIHSEHAYKYSPFRAWISSTKSLH